MKILVNMLEKSCQNISRINYYNLNDNYSKVSRFITKIHKNNISYTRLSFQISRRESVNLSGTTSLL